MVRRLPWILGVLWAVGCGKPRADVDAGDDAPDAPPAAVCGEQRICVEAPPDIWNGPVAIYQGDAAAPAPACPAEFPTNEHDLNTNLEAPGTCECECGDAQNVTCANATPRENNSATCTSVLDPLKTLAPGACTAVSVQSAKSFISLGGPVAVTGGICAPNRIDKLETPRFAEVTRACGGATVTSDGCDAESVCAPEAPDGFNAKHCVFLAGDNLCPEASAYTERFVAFDGFTDNRRCGECACEGATGSCSGSVQFLSDCDEAMPLAFESVSFGQCIDVTPSPQTGGAVFNPAPVATCAPSAGSVLAEAVETDPVTFCCLP